MPVAAVAGIERHRRWHRRPDPEVALLQRRQEFAAEPRCCQHAQAEEDDADDHGDLEIAQRPAKHRRVARAQGAHDDRLGFLDLLGQQQRGQHRRHREGREQRAGQRIAIGSRHRTEDLALDALHREQRHERGDGDGRREEHGLVDLQRADEDDAQSLRPPLARGGCGHAPTSDRCPNTLRQDAEAAFADAPAWTGNCG